MKRYAMNELIKWKSAKKRKPLIIRGARQVGKTWLMKEFGNTHYENVAYINFDNNERMEILFSGDYSISRLIDGLQVESGVQINPQTTVLLFDEIQEVPKALSSLKYFYENAPEYAIIAAGSLLGISEHKGTSFPVGKVDFIKLFPMNFCEYLEAIDEKSLAELLINKDWELISAFSSKYIDLLRKYYFVGGMPEAVAEFIESKDYNAVRKIHEQILFTYERDFSKHPPKKISTRIKSIWESIPAQLSKENKKFSPGIVKKGSRLSEYEDAFQWLTDSGLIYKIMQINKPSIPLSSYTTNVFKIYIHDVGLLCTKTEIDLKHLLDGNHIFEEFKGSLTEQFVLQELVAHNITPYYWSSNSTAEVDFVIKHDLEVFPLEVKAEENLQSKSLKVYKAKYNPSLSLRTSMKNYRKQDWLINIPLYAIGTYFS